MLPSRHKGSVNGGSPNPKGVILKGEEIERGGSLESHVCDIMKNANEERTREEHLNHLSYNKLLPTGIVGIQPVAENESFVANAADMMHIGLKIKELASVKAFFFPGKVSGLKKGYRRLHRNLPNRGRIGGGGDNVSLNINAAVAYEGMKSTRPKECLASSDKGMRPR